MGKTKIISFALIVVSSAFMIAMGEFVFGILNEKNHYAEKSTSQKPWFDYTNADTGRQLSPDNKITHEFYFGSEKVGSFLYSTDQYGRRLTSTSPSQKKTKHAIVLGCSFVFGSLNNDSDTLPQILNDLPTPYEFYNYGIPTHGTSHFLAYLQHTDLRPQIAQEEGMLLYVLALPQVRRMLNRNFYDKFFGYAPSFELDSEGDLIRTGDYFTSHPFETLLLKTAGRSEIIKYYDYFRWVKLSDIFTPEKQKLFMAMMKETKKEYLRQFPKGRFVVVVYPNLGLGPSITNMLREENIEIYDLSNAPYHYAKTEYRSLPLDPHPNRLFNEHFATDIVELLRLKE